MKIIKSLLILGVFIATSCVRSDDTYSDIPFGPEDGEYKYVSSSVYRDATNEVTNTGTNTGSIRYVFTNITTFSITPLRGWNYELQISNLQTHVLTDGSQVQTFRVSLQNVYVNGRQFNVMGTTTKKLLDSDGVTVIGTYDGVKYSNGDMEFGVLSVDLNNEETVTTDYTATLL